MFWNWDCGSASPPVSRCSVYLQLTGYMVALSTDREVSFEAEWKYAIISMKYLCVLVSATSRGRAWDGMGFTRARTHTPHTSS